MTIYAAVDENDTVVVQLGLPDPEGADAESPPDGPYTYHQIPAYIAGRPNEHILKWNGGSPAWQDMRTLDQARVDKAAELSTACATHILGGFVSSALGATYTYPSTILDQHNLNGLVTRSLYPGNPSTWVEKFWCADVAGVWARRDHTAAQLQQVGDEAIVRITAAQAKCDSKIAQANAATFEQLATLTWDSV